MNDIYIFALVSWILSWTVSYICLCRCTVSTIDVLLRVRVAYSLLGAGFAVVGISPLFGEWPGWAYIFAEVSVLALLISGSHRWKGRAPLDVRTDFQDFEYRRRIAFWQHLVHKIMSNL